MTDVLVFTTRLRQAFRRIDDNQVGFINLKLDQTNVSS